MHNPSKIIEDEIRNCDVVVFIYSLYSYDPLASVYLKAALGYFRRCFFFIADTDFSSLVNPEPKLEFSEPKPKLLDKLVKIWEEKKDQAQKAYHQALKEYNEEVTDQERLLIIVKKCFDTVFRFIDEKDFQSKLSDQFTKINDIAWYGLSDTFIRQRWADWAKVQMDEICTKKLDDRPILESPLWPFWEEFCSYSWLEKIQVAVSNLQLAAQPLVKREKTSSTAKTLQKIPEDLFSNDWIKIRQKLIDWCTSKTNSKIVNALNLIKKKKKKKKEANKEQTKTEVSQLQKELDDWKYAFKTLRSLLNSPRFGRCFLVIGRSGAGKTHFVAELLNKQKSSNQTVEYRCLYLKDVLIRSEKSYPEWKIDFEKILLRKAQLKLDDKQEIIQWESLAILDDFLCNQRPEQTRSVKLAIIIDEFSEWIKTAPKTFLANLKKFIEKHTHLRSLVWVFVIKETDYLFVSSDGKFFSTYVMPDLPTEVSLQGWLDLDKLNARGFSWRGENWCENSEKYLPLKRIFELEGLKAEQILVNILQSPKSISMKLLEIPLISWIAADWLNQPDSKMLAALPNLRFIDFVERFSSNRRNKIMDSGKLKTDEGVSLLEELDEMFVFLTEQLLRGIDQHSVQDLSTKIPLKLKDADLNLGDNRIIRLLIDLLTEYRLLEGKKNIRKLDSVLIWEYKAAQQIKKYLWLPKQNDIRANNIPQLDAALSRLFEKNEIVRNYLGIFEFFLLLIEKDFSFDNLHDSNKKDIQGIITFAFFNMPHLRSKIWTAIPKTSGSFQHNFIDWFKDQDHLQFHNKRDFFDYINFLRYAAATDPTNPDSGVPWDLRIKLLSNNFGYLEEWDFGSYFAKYILNPLCESIPDGERIALTMAHLRGIEDHYSRPREIIAEMTGIPYVDEEPYKRNEWMRIGKWSFDAIRGLLVSDNPCDQLYRWSMTMVNAVLEKGKNKSTNIKERARIWACCARYMLHFIVREKKEKVLQWFDDLKWPVWVKYSSEFQEDVFYALDEYLTLEIGKLWRISGEGDQEKYLVMLRDFAKSSNPLHQKTVFYSIQHTVPSPRHYKDDDSIRMIGSYPRIDERLWKILMFLEENSNSDIEGLFKGPFYRNQQEHFRNTSVDIE